MLNRLSVLCGLAAGCAVASGQSINLDFGGTLGVPSSTYGGAADQPGVWNVRINAEDAMLNPLVDINGEPTAVTMETFLPFGEGVANSDLTSGDDEALLDDYLVLRQSPHEWLVHGLNPGTYTLYLYGWAPDQDFFLTWFGVNGQEPRPVGGAFDGGLVEGITHARFTATVREGQDLVIFARGHFSGSFNGLQIVESGFCPADLSGSSDPNHAAYGRGDGQLDSSDFFFYLDMFVAGDVSIADLTGSSDPNDPAYGTPDGIIDGSDFFFYLDMFAAACR